MDLQSSFELLSYFSDFAVRIDAHGVILQASGQSQAFLKLSTALGQEPIELFFQPEDLVLFNDALESAESSGTKQAFVGRLLRQRVLPVWVDCYVYPLPEGGCVLVALDATHWKENEARLVHLATHDTLTGLPGRALLDDRIEVGINAARREKKWLALMLLDLDGFKKVNDTLGHHVGDALIKAVAERLRGCVRRSDTVARIGGDEFALIMMGTEQSAEELTAKKILAAVQRPFRIEGHVLHISTSLGTAVYPEHGDSPAQLFKCAEMAMYSAKSLGKNRWQIYNKKIDGAEQNDLSLEAAMHQGIEKGEFSLHYQPIFCAQTGELKGAESLMRWNHPTMGMVSPIKFIPLAESSGLIEILGTWALRMACYQARLWQEAQHGNFYISVNVSPRQFMQADFSGLVTRALNESGLAPSNLMLEITEGVLMESPQHSGAILAQLREIGIKIAIDDFGTGYSSLAYLKKFPLSVLKIDKSFVDDVPENPEDVAIIAAIMGLASGLGLTVVAEGVEHTAQLEFLRQKGCALIQGYLTGRPVAAELFQEKYIA